MPEMISNSSCIIVLDNIDMLWVLKELYGEKLKLNKFRMSDQLISRVLELSGE